MARLPRPGPIRAGLVGAVALVALSACLGPQPRIEAGRAAFVENCSSCHGAGARGDGPMSLFVATGVPDLRQMAQRNGGRFPRSYVIGVATRISDLHDDVVAMPDFGGLLSAAPTTHTAPDGTVIETDATIVAIADYLESVQD